MIAILLGVLAGAVLRERYMRMWQRVGLAVWFLFLAFATVAPAQTSAFLTLPAENSASDDTGSERSEHRDAQTNTSLHSEEKEETR